MKKIIQIVSIIIVVACLGFTTYTLILSEKNVLPVVNAGKDQIVDVGETAYFEGSAEDPDGAIIKYEWDFDGDGIFDWTSDNNGRASYYFNSSGTYSVVFRAIDENGGNSIDSCNITVIDRFLFVVNMNKTIYEMGEAINITISLKNIESSSINVSEVGLGMGPPTLDFEITTPEGYVIHYMGPFVTTMPTGIKLESGNEHVSTQNLRETMWVWGNDDGISNYNFTTSGNYTIVGVYRSEPSQSFDNTVWEGVLHSNILTFTITT